jgi:hypothetical protein
LLHHLDDLQRRARRIFHKGKLGKAHAGRLDEELYTFVPQVSDGGLKVIDRKPI